MTWYHFLVFVHIVSAIMWVGGILFMGIVAIPAVRRLEITLRFRLLHDFGTRFVRVGYTLLAILIVTGILQASARGATWHNVLDGTFFQTHFGSILAKKLIYFLIMISVSIAHDFFVGPASVRAAKEGKETERLRVIASWLARITALFALIVVGYAVLLVR